MSTNTRHGYLVIADISGYTSFVAKTELEHSQEILTELLELLMARFQPLMTISKLEGDAVFTYAPESLLPSGETLIEFIESMYMAFRDKQTSMRQATTCACNACRNIPTLDLKFFAHHGDYIVQQVMNIRELIGSDVNLIHRLTKNHVSETTSWRAYAMFTENCLEHMQLNLPALYWSSYYITSRLVVHHELFNSSKSKHIGSESQLRGAFRFPTELLGLAQLSFAC